MSIVKSIGDMSSSVFIPISFIYWRRCLHKGTFNFVNLPERIHTIFILGIL